MTKAKIIKTAQIRDIYHYTYGRYTSIKGYTHTGDTSIKGLVHLSSDGFALPRSAFDSASDSRARGPGFDTRSGHTLSFLLPLIQEGQLSVTGESMYTKNWLTGKEV